MDITHLSSKGQVVIPHEIREAHQWVPGTEFAIIDNHEGISLIPIKPFKKIPVKDIVGCVGYQGPKKSLQEMQAGIIKGAVVRK